MNNKLDLLKKLVPFLLLLLFIVLAVLAYSDDAEMFFTKTVAIISLAISLFGFYFQYFNKTHELSCTIVEVSITDTKLNAHLTFENTGNYQEIILGGTFIFPKKGTSEYSTITRKGCHSMLPELHDPFVLKPEQIEVIHFEWSVSNKELLRHFRIEKGQEFLQNVQLKIDFINPSKRSKSSKRIDIGTIKSYSDSFEFMTMNFRQTKLFEGKLSPL